MLEQGNMLWPRVAAYSAVPADEALAVVVGDRQVALCKVDGTIHAIDNICTHEYACLSDGFIEGDQIECPLHQARFHIPSGKVVTPPACIDLQVYPVKIEGDDVYIGVMD